MYMYIESQTKHMLHPPCAMNPCPIIHSHLSKLLRVVLGRKVGVVVVQLRQDKVTFLARCR